MTRPACPAAVPTARIAEWFLGDLAPADQPSFEEHLFACDVCTQEARVFAALAQAIRLMSDTETLLTQEAWEALAASGEPFGQGIVAPGGELEARFAPGTERFVIRMRVPPATGPLAFEMLSPAGATAFHAPDVPFDAEAGEVRVACRRHFGAIVPVIRFRISSGGRVLGEYVVRHVLESAERP